MSEASDFPDPFGSSEPGEPNVPFNPSEHFGSLSEPHVEDHLEVPTDAAFAHPVEMDVTPPSPPYVPSSGKPYQPSPARGIGVVLIAGSLILGSAIGVAFIAGKQLAPATPAPAPDATAGKPAADDIKPIAPQVDAVKAEIEALSKRLDDVQKHLAAMPKPASATDLAPIEAKLASMAKQLDAAPAPAVDTKGIEAKIEKVATDQSDLIAKLDAVNTKVGGFEKSLTAATSAVAAIQAKVKTLSEAKPSETPVVNADAEFAQGVDLFKKSQFARAKELFTKLEKVTPDDARVWYYAAMANGFATNQWTGESETLVAKGMSLEKAGTPDVDKINATFADLAPGAKGWLDTYRGRIIR